MKNTREAWLLKATSKLRSGLFKRYGYKIPKVKVSVGFAQGSKKAIGQHWSPESSSDKTGQIFIDPRYDDELEVLAILVHELVHAAVKNKYGHGPIFRRCAEAVGLEGKMRSTHAGPELKRELRGMIKKTGKYPHAKLNLTMGPKKKQTTRMVKMICGDCGYIARTSMTNIVAHGTTICPCNGEAMEGEIK